MSDALRRDTVSIVDKLALVAKRVVDWYHQILAGDVHSTRLHMGPVRGNECNKTFD